MSHNFFKISFLFLSAIAYFLSAGQAMAVTQSVTAKIAFATAISLTKNADINFGTLNVGTPGIYTITTGGIVTSSDKGKAVPGMTTAGNITLAGARNQLINISVDEYTTDGGVQLQNATCSYDGSIARPCEITDAAAPGAGKTLLLGVQAIVSGKQITKAAPAFTVSIVYQ